MKKKKQRKYRVSRIGKRKCKTCKKFKNVNKFPINRVIKGGRRHTCSKCTNLHFNTKRRNRNIFYPIYKSNNVPLVSNYKKYNCEICNIEFFQVRPSHIKCTDCSVLCREVQSYLRRGKNIKNKMKVAKFLTKLYITSNNCQYCGIVFNDKNIKHIDHIIPIGAGGINKETNFAITCKDCNQSKHAFNFKYWKNCCNIIYANKKKIINLISKLNINIIIYNSLQCYICGVAIDNLHKNCKRCLNCKKIIKKINGSLTSNRYYKSMPAGKNLNILISQKYISTTKCPYCDREFTKSNPKSIDHVNPICKDGKNEANNILICCLHCNRMKCHLTINEWLNLCSLISKNNS